MAAKRYRLLRKKMRELEVTQEYLGKLIGRSESYVNRALCGERSFEMDEAYLICKELNISQDEITLYFPPGGIETENLGPKKYTFREAMLKFADLAERGEVTA